jgi:hypothetical protein
VPGAAQCSDVAVIHLGEGRIILVAEVTPNLWEVFHSGIATGLGARLRDQQNGRRQQHWNQNPLHYVSYAKAYVRLKEMKTDKCTVADLIFSQPRNRAAQPRGSWERSRCTLAVFWP